MQRSIIVIMVMALLSAVSATAVMAAFPYQSNFSAGTDGWMPVGGTGNQSTWNVVSNRYVGDTVVYPAPWENGISFNPDVSLPSGGSWVYELDMELTATHWGSYINYGNNGIVLAVPGTTTTKLLIDAQMRNTTVYLDAYSGVTGQRVNSASMSHGTSQKYHLKVVRPAGSTTVNIELTNDQGGKIGLTSIADANLGTYTKPGLIVVNSAEAFSNIQMRAATGADLHPAYDASNNWNGLRGWWTKLSDGYTGELVGGDQYALALNDAISLPTSGGWGFETDLEMLNSYWPGLPNAGNIGVFITSTTVNWWQALVQVWYRDEVDPYDVTYRNLYVQCYNQLTGQSSVAGPIRNLGDNKCHLKVARASGSNFLSVELSNASGDKTSLNSWTSSSIGLWTRPGLMAYNADAKFSNMSVYNIYPVASDPRTQPDGSVFRIQSNAVTAALGGFFYIESPDRKFGIRVNAANAVAVGDPVDVAGQIFTNLDGERYIDAWEVTSLSGSKVFVKPFGMPNKTTGGGPLGLQGGVENDSSGGWISALGLNNIGLLVKVWGKVTSVGTGYFYIEDGSGLNDGSGSAGIKVIGSIGTDKVGHMVSVIGVTSCEKPGGHVLRTIRARSNSTADITPLN